MNSQPRLKIVATCALCGHELPSWFDKEAMNAHLAEAHGLYFDPPPPFTPVGGREKAAEPPHPEA